MAIFIGNLKEFNRYFGPYVRNTINTICRNERKAMNNVCEHCGQKSELQSAHVEGKGRLSIISNVFEEFHGIERNGVEIELIINEIIKRHYPIKDTFKFLCESCHRIYDKRTASLTTKSISRLKIVKEINDLYLIENEIKRVKRKVPKWFMNPMQINSIILISYFKLYDNRFVDSKDLEKLVNLGSKFSSNLNQMSIISKNNHAKVFEITNQDIHLWEPVRQILIDMYHEYKGKTF